MKIRLNADKLTNVLGMLGAVLIVQQTYWPELLPRQYVAPILASIVSTFGIATNKRKITILLNGENEQSDKTIEELEAEVERRWQEIEEAISRTERACRARHRGNNHEY
jgi:hypothetical protein